MRPSRSRLEKLDAILFTLARLGFHLAWVVLLAICVGATAFAVTHVDQLAPMMDNRLPHADRLIALRYFGVSLLVLVVVYALALGWRYRKTWPPGFARAKRLHGALSFLASGPALVALTEPAIETNHTWRTWLYIFVVVAAWWPTFWVLATRPRGGRQFQPLLSEHQRDVLGLAAACLIWGAYAYFFIRLSITNHHSINTRIIDLGLYDNIFFHTIHGDPLGCSFMKGGNHAAAHFDPILVVLSPLYRLWQGPEFLLTLQSVWCGAGAVGAYLLGRYQLGSRSWGLIWALAYALHPALHGANLYEFHSLTLLFSPFLFALHFLLSGRTRLYFVTLGLLLLIREDVSLLMSFVGLFALISKDPSRRRTGWITILVCLSYFAVVKAFFMTSHGLFNEGPGSYGFGYYYKEMMPNNKGGLSFVLSLLTNPAYVLALITKEPKLLYLMMIFAPLLFLSFAAGRARVVLIYGLVFVLLASRSAVYSPHFQYSAVLLPVALGLAPVGLRRLGGARGAPRAFIAATMGCVLLASVLTSWKHGAIVENKSFRGGFRGVKRVWDEKAAERYEEFRALVDQIEPDASVSATDRVGSHVSTRLSAYRLNQDIETDYVLVHTTDVRGRNKSILERRKKDGTLEVVGRARQWTLYRTVPPAERKTDTAPAPGEQTTPPSEPESE